MKVFRDQEIKTPRVDENGHPHLKNTRKKEDTRINNRSDIEAD
jgi:hypothetical protein